jgi:hypothetical protein
MTAAERQELGKLVRLRAKLAKEDADARGKQLLATAEATLAAVYDARDEAWADITEHARKVVEDADAAIAAICRQRGLEEAFRPELHLSWWDRGQNASGKRRAELRKVAQTEVAARVKQAHLEIDRQAERQLTQITRAGLTSEEARAFIDTMPTAEELLPPLASLQLPGGEMFALEAPAPVTAVTDKAVTAVTASRNKCAFCGGEFTPNRRDAKYCKPACRVTDHRRKIAKED